MGMFDEEDEVEIYTEPKKSKPAPTAQVKSKNLTKGKKDRSFRLDVDLIEKLEAMAKSDDRSVNITLNRLLRKAL